MVPQARRILRRIVRPSLLLSILFATVGCYNEPVEDLAVWSEFLPLEDVHDHLPTLAAHDASLYLAIAPEMVDEELRAFLVDAEAQGVEVRPWLQLPEMGIWLNEDNVDAFAAFALDYLAWASTNAVRPDYMIFDLEPSFDYAEELRAAVDTGGARAAIELLLDHRDAGRFAEAQETLRYLVNQVQAQGVGAMAVVLPWIIDDLWDADTDFQDIFDTCIHILYVGLVFP